MAIVFDLGKVSFEDIKQEIHEDTAALIQDIGVGITNELRGNPPEGTPVDTGWASNNWIPAIRTPPTEPHGIRPERKEGQTGKIFFDDTATEAGIASLLTYRFGEGTVFVVNNVPYIEELNQGSSRQSPTGFVENAIDKTLDKVVLRREI